MRRRRRVGPHRALAGEHVDDVAWFGVAHANFVILFRARRPLLHLANLMHQEVEAEGQQDAAEEAQHRHLGAVLRVRGLEPLDGLDGEDLHEGDVKHHPGAHPERGGEHLDVCVRRAVHEGAANRRAQAREDDEPEGQADVALGYSLMDETKGTGRQKIGLRAVRTRGVGRSEDIRDHRVVSRARACSTGTEGGQSRSRTMIYPVQPYTSRTKDESARW